MMSACARDLGIFKQERNLHRSVIEYITKITEINASK